MGRERKMKEHFDEHNFAIFFSWLAFPTAPFVVKCWRRDVPLGTLLMVHSPAHHQNSLNSGTVLIWFCFIFIWVKYISYFSVFSPFSLGCVSFSYFKGFIGKNKHTSEIIPIKPPKAKTPQKCVRCLRCHWHHFPGRVLGCPGVKTPSLEVLGVIACYSGALLMCLGWPDIGHGFGVWEVSLMKKKRRDPGWFLRECFGDEISASYIHRGLFHKPI